MSRELAFKGLSQGSSEMARAGAEVGIGVQTSRTVLKICYKSFSEYLGILIAVAGNFGPGSPAGYLENFDLRGKKESKRVMERCSWQKRPWLYIEVILALIFR